jgi:hypothetical protein
MTLLALVRPRDYRTVRRPVDGSPEQLPATLAHTLRASADKRPQLLRNRDHRTFRGGGTSNDWDFWLVATDMDDAVKNLCNDPNHVGLAAVTSQYRL